MSISATPTRPLIVQKFGGMSLATPEHIKGAARRVAELRATGVNVLVVVSAMGAATDGLIQLAYSVSSQPNRRELDMLLSTGERVSMSLFSMALSDALKELVPEAKAISFTGSQAGLLTDETHSNARIVDIKSIRVQEELTKGHVVILAGFQGVSPRTKEITTLGRGGTDVTAVAMAAAFSANRCEILKEVPGVMSADPRFVGSARVLPELTHLQLLEMTFWGAKVLHYRSVELATTHQVPLKVALAHDANVSPQSQQNSGTEIRTSANSDRMENAMNSFENDRVLAVNSHADVRKLQINSIDLHGALESMKTQLLKNSLPLPQILHATRSAGSEGTFEILITAPAESLEAQTACLQTDSQFKLDKNIYSTITATCQGSYTTDLVVKFAGALKAANVDSIEILQGPMSVTFLVDAPSRKTGLNTLHGFTA